MKKLYVKIDGMSCSHCEETLKNSLLSLKNVKSVEFNGFVAVISYTNKLDHNLIIKTVKDKSWNFSRIIFAVAGVMSIVTIIFCQTVLDFVRLFATEFCIIMFLLQRDGIGEEGVVSLGQFFSYKDVKAYDVHEAGKKTNCLFMVEEKGAKKTSEYTLELSFAAKDTEIIKT